MSGELQQSQENEVWQPTPEQFNRFLENQTREFDLREKELTLRQQQDKRGFEYAQKTLEAQAADLHNAREHEILKQRNTFYFSGAVVLFVLVFMAFALFIGQGEFVKDVAKMIFVFAAGAVSGFQYGKNKK
ncbi:MAG: hypothetical protein II965_05560 [Pyramidobacter sp.]|nr:hypothetical protein [Pyramidobacter sp.]MBP3752247.1 hypothetical protein [Pyramidobacter sp.]MBP3837030.1 hypothetical protein [Pyramidobacter sp.]MBQ4490698.1 hypothetical protein [Pyramidobacter sp.]MBQ8090438.1 hypothetical protein [Pyramidobacter sp.]